MEDVIHRDVPSEVEGRVDRLATLDRLERLARAVLGVRAGALGAALVALAQLVDAAALEQPIANANAKPSGAAP